MYGSATPEWAEDESGELSEGFMVDKSLLAAVREGEMWAAGELYKIHIDRAQAFAYRLTGDRGRAEEAASEAFTKVLEAIHRGKGPSVSMGLYLRTSIRSVVANHGRNREIAVDEEQLLRQVETESLLDEGSGETSEPEVAVISAFNNLREKEQQLIWSLAVDGLSVSDYAKELKVAPPTVTMRYRRARNNFRGLYLSELASEIHTVECQPTLRELGHYVAGTLPPKKRAVVDAHLEHCEACTETVDKLRNVAQRFLIAIPPTALGLLAGKTLREPQISAGVGASAAAIMSTPALVALIAGVAIAGLASAGVIAAVLPKLLGAGEQPVAAATRGPSECAVSYLPGGLGSAGAFEVANPDGIACTVTYGWEGETLTTMQARRGSTRFDAPRRGGYEIHVATETDAQTRSFTVG